MKRDSNLVKTSITNVRYDYFYDDVWCYIADGFTKTDRATRTEDYVDLIAKTAKVVERLVDSEEDDYNTPLCDSVIESFYRVAKQENLNKTFLEGIGDSL